VAVVRVVIVRLVIDRDRRPWSEKMAVYPGVRMAMDVPSVPMFDES